MKQSAILAAVAGLAVSAGLASAQVFSASPGLQVISGGTNLGTVSNTITVSGGPSSISDLNVIFQCTHTWDADIDIVLQGPTGYICLSTDNGGSADNYQTTRFDDAATNSISAGGTLAAAPFNGNYRPEGTLNGWAGSPAAFTGTNFATLGGFNGTDSNGAWTLYVADDTGGDSGTWSYWSLEFNGAVDPTGPTPINGPTNPAVIGSANPNPANPGASVHFAATVTPGINPTSTGIAVTLNGSLLGLGSVTLFDDGLHNDGAANDNVFGADATLSAGAAAGTYTLPLSVTDAQSRSGSATFSFTVNFVPQWDETNQGGGDAGDLPATAQIIGGTPGDPLTGIGGSIAANNDVDMFAIQICDPATFSANYDTTATTIDTQAWLFNADGTGVEFNDDGVTLRSQLNNAFVTTPGLYYLAITGYNQDALDADGALLWNNQPFTGVRAPDGPGAANPLASWNTGGFNAGTYGISLTGACVPVVGPTCDPDTNQDGVSDQGDVDYLINVIAGGDNPTGIDADFNRDGVADQGDVDALVNVIAGGPCP